MSGLMDYKVKRSLFKFVKKLLHLRSEEHSLKDTAFDILIDNFVFKLNENMELTLEDDFIGD